MTGNPWFPSPFPSLAEVEAATDDLFESETRTLTRVVDSVTERDAKRLALVSLLQRLASYVQAIAIANPEHRAEIVESASMYLKKAGGPSGRTFHAKQKRANELEVFAPGLPSRSMVHLRYRATVKGVTGDWSQTIAIMVE